MDREELSPGRGGRRAGAGAKPKAPEAVRDVLLPRVSRIELEAILPHLPDDLRARLLAKLERERVHTADPREGAEKSAPGD